MSASAVPARYVENIVGGVRTESAADRRCELVDPSTGVVFGSAPVSGPNDVDRAYRAAAEAFVSWRESTPAQRQHALLGLAGALEVYAGDLIEAECQNTGKPQSAMRGDELPQIIDQLRFFAGACRVVEGRGAGEYLADHTSYVRREPVGVIGQVAPWNYPLMEAVWKVAPAIAAGNTVVLKPGDTTPVSAVMFAELAAEFLPPGVLNVVCGDRDTGRQVVAHPAAAMVAITGSTRAGAEVAAAAAADLKRVHLELGGKAPVLVFADADLPDAARIIVDAAYYNAGQDCTAASRVMVADEVADDFAALLAQTAEKVTVGAPHEDATYGPLNNAGRLEVVNALMERLPAHASVLTGGTPLDRPGYFWQPTVISGLRQYDEMSQREIFAPIITVQRFGDEAEAVRCANDVEFGLAASVWTADHDRALRVSRRLDFGTVWINAHTVTVAEMPHGGFKHSGYGKDLSIYGLEDYTRLKHVVHRTRR